MFKLNRFTTHLLDVDLFHGVFHVSKQNAQAKVFASPEIKQTEHAVVKKESIYTNVVSGKCNNKVILSQSEAGLNKL